MHEKTDLCDRMKPSPAILLVFFMIFNVTAGFSQINIAPGGTHEFFETSYSSFMPSSVSVTYSGDGSAYFTRSGLIWLTSIRLSTQYMIGATFTYQCSSSTPNGTYIGKFTITFTSGSQSVTLQRAVTFVVSSGTTKPVADFSASPTSGFAPLEVQFTDLSTGSITDRLWDFGDSLTSTEKNPKHTYARAGSYSVKLRVANSAGFDEKLRVNFINPTAPQARVDIALRQGWNLISWNVDTAIDSTQTLLRSIQSKIIVVLGFESEGQTYDPRLPNLNTLPFMDHLHGYWIKMSSRDTLRLTGTQVDYTKTIIHCEPGWNLVSFLPTEPDSIQHGFTSVLNSTDVALGYSGSGMTFSPQLPDFSTLQVLSPKLGYWLRLSRAADLIYPAPLPGIKSALQASPGVAKSSGRLAYHLTELLLPSNEWISIYGNDIVVRGNLLPAGTDITAKDREGNICGKGTARQAGVFGFMPVYRDDPNTEIDEGAKPGEEITLYYGNEKAPVVLRWTQMGDIIDINTASTAMEENEPLQPDEFRLAQNYPNPFNATTKIGFQLPRTVQTSLRIYNARGNLIVTLINETRQAGWHQVSWNGRDQNGRMAASGLYIYQLKAGEIEQSKKMLLVY